MCSKISHAKTVSKELSLKGSSLISATKSGLKFLLKSQVVRLYPKFFKKTEVAPPPIPISRIFLGEVFITSLT